MSWYYNFSDLAATNSLRWSPAHIMDLQVHDDGLVSE